MNPDYFDAQAMYQEGDVISKDGSIFVYTNGAFMDIHASNENLLYNACKSTVDEYHKTKNLPSYDEIMKVFFEARPEYFL
jgi:uncharacterized Fe-S cluster-containing MiaB family protein